MGRGTEWITKIQLSFWRRGIDGQGYSGAQQYAQPYLMYPLITIFAYLADYADKRIRKFSENSKPFSISRQDLNPVIILYFPHRSFSSYEQPKKNILDIHNHKPAIVETAKLHVRRMVWENNQNLGPTEFSA